jgi:hypothetical protein
MDVNMNEPLTVAQIIKMAGGADAIAEASAGAFKKDAVYKWTSIGVPDRHWQILIDRAGVTAEQLYAANLAAREVAA